MLGWVWGRKPALLTTALANLPGEAHKGSTRDKVACFKVPGTFATCEDEQFLSEFTAPLSPHASRTTDSQSPWQGVF